MRRTFAAISLLTFIALSLSPAFAKPHDYPMQVQVINSHWHGRRGWSNGFGHANLFANEPGRPPKQGMDFNFSCSQPIRHTFMPDTYRARWGKNQYEVVVLLPVLGTDKGSECTMKIEMRNFVYQGGRGGLHTLPLDGGPPTPMQEDGQQSN